MSYLQALLLTMQIVIKSATKIYLDINNYSLTFKYSDKEIV